MTGLLITTEAMVAEKPEPKASPAMPDMGGMGGGMGFDKPSRPMSTDKGREQQERAVPRGCCWKALPFRY